MSTGRVGSGLFSAEQQRELNNQWRALRRLATGVAILTSPAVFIWLHRQQGWSLGWSIVATIVAVAAFRGALDLIFHRFIRWPSLFGIDNPRLREEDVVARRRVWFWRFWAKVIYFIALVILAIYAVRVVSHGFDSTTVIGTAKDTFSWIWHNILTSKGFWTQIAILPLFFLINFVVLMGPLMAMGVSQIRGFEPGDANWGVKLDDVRGQAEAKEEVRRVVNLWQSGEAFEEAGGRRERGLLFLGAPGTGKTMLAKAIATGFNSPIVTIPGSGFAQAQPLDSNILTPRGWTAMGAIDVGDEVIDPEGGTARVIGVFPQGVRDIYRVTLSDGSSTECDLDHLWQVRRHRRRPWRVETLREIKEKLETDSRQNRPYIPLVQDVEFEEQELPLDPYLLGVLLGDGCFTTTTPSLIAAEPELVGAAAARLPIGVSAEEKTTLKSLGLFGHGALTKFVPDAYKYASENTRLE